MGTGRIHLRGCVLSIQQREKTCRPRHKREGPAAKRWEGLVFSTAECPRRTTDRICENVQCIEHGAGADESAESSPLSPWSVLSRIYDFEFRSAWVL